MLNTLTRLFPIWALLLTSIAWYLPGPFSQGKELILPLLMVIMFGMGMTLTAADFRRVLQRPKVIALGAVLQYSLMPLLAYLLSHLLGLSTELTVGMILVGASSGGTASNVITYLARGDVALSITLTMVSTLLALLLLPGLTWLYIGQMVPVPLEKMLISILQLVLAPVLLGVIINTLFGSKLRPLNQLFPLLSMSAIVLIIAIIVSLNHDNLTQMGPLLLLAVVLHNLGGMGLGYFIPRWLGHDVVTCRTLAIEVGMQNSGLSVALAVKYFGVAAALPGAIFSIWHNLSGSLIAGWWARRIGQRLDRQA
jgi:bile acid:Na+ symporter, BASS family